MNALASCLGPGDGICEWNLAKRGGKPMNLSSSSRLTTQQTQQLTGQTDRQQTADSREDRQQAAGRTGRERKRSHPSGETKHVKNEYRAILRALHLRSHPVQQRGGKSIEALLLKIIIIMSEEEVNPATAVPQQQQQIVPAVPGAGEEETVKCFVGQVPRAYEEAELRQLFEPYGTVVDTSVIRHKETGQHRGRYCVSLWKNVASLTVNTGCAFVVFASKQFADNAITALHESQVLPGMTHKLQVKYADGELERLGTFCSFPLL